MAVLPRDRKEKCRHPSLFTEQRPSGFVPDLSEDNLLERLRREFAVLGFLCDRHPIIVSGVVENDMGAATLRAESLKALARLQGMGVERNYEFTSGNYPVKGGIWFSISGSAIANTVTTGAFTIPLMKRAGFKPKEGSLGQKEKSLIQPEN